MEMLMFKDDLRLEPAINDFMSSVCVGLHPVYALMTIGWDNIWPMPILATTIFNASLSGSQQLVQRTSDYAQIRSLFRRVRTVNPSNPPSLCVHANLVTQSRSVNLM